MLVINFSNISSIYNEHLETLIDYATHLGFDKHIAMDAIHDMFYKLCIRRVKIDKPENLQFYLFRLLRNRLIDIRRKQKTHLEFCLNGGEAMGDLQFHLQPTVEDKIIMEEDKEEIHRKIEHVLSKLTHRQREIIYLRYLHEYSYEEIAEIMEISIESSRNLLSRAIGHVKNNNLPIYFLILYL